MSRIFCAPFFYVSFADFWLADQLNSLHTVFLDFQYFVCFYIQNSSWTDVTGQYNLYHYLYKNKSHINIKPHKYIVAFFNYISFIYNSLIFYYIVLDLLFIFLIDIQ